MNPRALITMFYLLYSTGWFSDKWEKLLAQVITDCNIVEMRFADSILSNHIAIAAAHLHYWIIG